MYTALFLACFPYFEKIKVDLWPHDVDINRAWETIRGNIKISAQESPGYYELKKHKSWFDEGCSKLLDQREQAELQ
jgi:hypothetical protein